MEPTRLPAASLSRSSEVSAALRREAGSDCRRPVSRIDAGLAGSNRRTFKVHVVPHTSIPRLDDGAIFTVNN